MNVSTSTIILNKILKKVYDKKREKNGISVSQPRKDSLEQLRYSLSSSLMVTIRNGIKNRQIQLCKMMYRTMTCMKQIRSVLFVALSARLGANTIASLMTPVVTKHVAKTPAKAYGYAS